jgi:hypothetical protein
MQKLTTDTSSTQEHEFLLVEYKECSMAFFKGVDIGFLYIRLFFLLNAALAAVYQFDENLLKKIGGAGNVVPFLAPSLGLIFCIMLSLFVPYYRRQLDHCAFRCAEIEKIYGGQLFSGIFKEYNRQRAMTATVGIYALSAIIGFLWLLALPWTDKVLKVIF